MSPRVGEIILVEFPTATPNVTKKRPAIVLAKLRGPRQWWLLCGISSDLSELVPDWDEPFFSESSWFGASGLERDSIARLSFLDAVAEEDISGQIGVAPSEMVERMRARLAAQLALQA